MEGWMEPWDNDGRRPELRPQSSLRDVIEQAVEARMMRLTATMEREFELRYMEAIEKITDSVRDKFIHRMNELESDLAAQARLLADLGQQTGRAEQSLVRLARGVEKITELRPAGRRAPI